MQQHQRRLSGEESAPTIEQQNPERRKEWRELEWPPAVLGGPGAYSDGDPIRPELDLRLKEQQPGPPPHIHALAQRAGFRKRRGSGEEPNRYFRRACLEMCHCGMTRSGRDPEDRRNFLFTLTQKRKNRLESNLDPHVSPHPRLRGRLRIPATGVFWPRSHCRPNQRFWEVGAARLGMSASEPRP